MFFSYGVRLCQKHFNHYWFSLETQMAQSVTGTIRSAKLGFIISMSLVVSSVGSLAWSRPAFLDQPIDATFQRISLAQLISQLSTISEGFVVLDRLIDPTQYVTLTCQGEDPLTVSSNSLTRQALKSQFLNQPYGSHQSAKYGSLEVADDERKATFQKLPVRTRQSLSTKQLLQWQAGQKPLILIEKLLARTNTDSLTITPDDLSTVIPHDHLAAGSIPPLSLPEQLDLVAMQYNQHILWKQSSRCIGCFSEFCSTSATDRSQKTSD